MTSYEQTAASSFDNADNAQCQLATLLDVITGKLNEISTDNAVRSVPDIHAACELLDVAAIILNRLEAATHEARRRYADEIKGSTTRA